MADVIGAEGAGAWACVFLAERDVSELSTPHRCVERASLCSDVSALNSEKSLGGYAFLPSYPPSSCICASARNVLTSFTV